jgi:hypothetical protein
MRGFCQDLAVTVGNFLEDHLTYFYPALIAAFSWEKERLTCLVSVRVIKYNQ